MDQASRRADRGRAAQVLPIKPTLKAPGTNRFKPKFDNLLSFFAFNFNLRRYIGDKPTGMGESGQKALTKFRAVGAAQLLFGKGTSVVAGESSSSSAKKMYVPGSGGDSEKAKKGGSNAGAYTRSDFSST